jgi:hypothetical protein
MWQVEQVTVGQRVAGALSLLACGDASVAPFVGRVDPVGDSMT